MGFAISKQMNLRYPTVLGKGNHRLNVSLGGGYVSFLEGNCFPHYWRGQVFNCHFWKIILAPFDKMREAATNQPPVTMNLQILILWFRFWSSSINLLKTHYPPPPLSGFNKPANHSFYHHLKIHPPKTNSSHLKMDPWKMRFLLETIHFQVQNCC